MTFKEQKRECKDGVLEYEGIVLDLHNHDHAVKGMLTAVGPRLGVRNRN